MNNVSCSRDSAQEPVGESLRVNICGRVEQRVARAAVAGPVRAHAAPSHAPSSTTLPVSFPQYAHISELLSAMSTLTLKRINLITQANDQSCSHLPLCHTLHTLIDRI